MANSAGSARVSRSVARFARTRSVRSRGVPGAQRLAVVSVKSRLTDSAPACPDAGVQVQLIRHSLAVDEGPGIVDEHRYLSASGRDRAQRVGARLRQLERAPGRIYTSPLVRAVQTAELIAAATGLDEPVVVLAPLAPGYPPELVARHLGELGDSIALVGHMPAISALGAVLASRPAFPPLVPGQVCALDRGQPAWSLRPETLQIEPLLLA